MTAVAPPPSFEQINRSAWGASSQGILSHMSADEFGRMFMPRKSSQRSNSSSSISSTNSTSSTATIPQSTIPSNEVAMLPSGDGSRGRPKLKRPGGSGQWAASKAENLPSISNTRPQSIMTNAVSNPSSLISLHPSPIVQSQHLDQKSTHQHNGGRPSTQSMGDGNPMLYLLSMNGTFERKTISVPCYPDTIRIGRQTNAKTLPTPANGFFDSKVLSRQHAEIWADRNGKIWIRDVKSSNGTFVNSVRLSAENKDSEPHELQTQDQLELGIDIVSEDQKTVVHHKVAAKVEHAGYLGASNNVLDMSFGDLDPANGSLLLPSPGGIPMRGRTGSHGSFGSNGRMVGPGNVAGSNVNVMGQNRAIGLWLSPVTTEQIAKRISHEIRTARLQARDLGHADVFFGSLLNDKDVKDQGNPPTEYTKPLQNDGSSPNRADNKTRFSDPPAPPPQQPLPDKPDASRSLGSEPCSSSLKRTNTERPRSASNVSPIRQEPTSQIISLVEALAGARKDIEAQDARMRDLEGMLQQERQAREIAEEVARNLEYRSSEIRQHPRVNGSILDEAFDPPSGGIGNMNSKVTDFASVKDKHIDTAALTNSSRTLEKRLEDMLVEMGDLKQQMESYKTRAEIAEADRDASRETLAQMVESIRTDESHKPLIEGQRSALQGIYRSIHHGDPEAFHATLAPLLQRAGLSNGVAHGPGGHKSSHVPTGILSRAPDGRESLKYHSAPYASMIGVVLVGMGLMAYLNGWQPPKVDR